MVEHVCPWWGGYFIDNRLRRLLHNPVKILAPYVHRGTTAMDFGCGMGFCSIAMAALTGDEGRVIAVDLQEQMLQTLQKRAEKAGVANRIRTHQCPPDSLGVDEPVDFALAFWSAHEVPNVEAWFTQLHGCLVAGGKLLLIEPRGHVGEADFAEMISMAREAGFGLEEPPPIRLSRAATFVKA